MQFFVKLSKSIIFPVKSFLGSFYRHLVIFSGHTACDLVYKTTNMFWSFHAWQAWKCMLIAVLRPEVPNLKQIIVQCLSKNIIILVTNCKITTANLAWKSLACMLMGVIRPEGSNKHEFQCFTHRNEVPTVSYLERLYVYVELCVGNNRSTYPCHLTYTDKKVLQPSLATIFRQCN